MTTITLHLDDDIIQKIDTLRGTEKRSECIRNLIVFALEYNENTIKHESEHKKTTSEHKEITTEHKEDVGESARELIIELELKDRIIESKDQTIKTLEHEVGFLTQEHSRVIGQLDRFLLPAPQEINKKAWWQIWKL